MTTPSFAYKLAEARRHAAELRRTHELTEPVFSINEKDHGVAFAARHGLRIPRRLIDPVDVERVDFDELPDRFVIKPVDGSTSRGVYALHRRDDGQYTSLLDGRCVIDAARVRQLILDHANAGRVSRQVLVEELIHDGPPEDPRPPVDWRLFCFYGQVGLVMGRDVGFARDPRAMGFRFFDDAWVDLGQLRQEVRHAPDLPPPRHAAELIAAGRRLSSAIPRAMVRVDLFDVEEGVLFNEITPLPGGELYFGENADRRFGEMWEAAEMRVMAEAIRSGAFALREGAEVEPDKG